MNKQPLSTSTLPVCLFHPSALGKREWELCLPERKMLMGEISEVPGSMLGSGLCSASSYGQDISSEALKPLEQEEG